VKQCCLQSVSMENSWRCTSCNNVNPISQGYCQNCGYYGSFSLNGTLQIAGADNNHGNIHGTDWACLVCNYSNFGRNKACLSCSTARPDSRSVNSNSMGGGKASRPNDWLCSCGDLVFGSRFACRSCGCPRPQVPHQMNRMGGNMGRSTNNNNYSSHNNNSYSSRGGGGRYQHGGMGGSGPGNSNMKPGDWICTCGEHVYASKGSCRGCGAAKPMPAVGGVAKVQDWFCSCSYQNFGTRIACHKCALPRPENPTYLQPGQPQLVSREPSYQQSYSQYPQANRAEVRPGDWGCSCGFNNYSNRIDCYKCKSPKPMQHQQ
jgi:hypothetical protein